MVETVNEALNDQDVQIPDRLPVLPLRDVVAFPYIVLPLSVGRQKSLKAVDRALSGNRMILLVAQKDKDILEPSTGDIYNFGTVGLVMRMLKLPDGNMKLIVQGLQRAEVAKYEDGEELLEALVNPIPEEEEEEPNLRTTALMRNVKSMFEKSISLGNAVASEVNLIINNLENPGRLADLVASELSIKVSDAQEILETVAPVKRLKQVNKLLSREIELLSVQQEINTQTKGEIDKTQREYFLRQQLKAIREELGETGELSEEIEDFRKKIKKAGMSEEALEECERQLTRLERMNPESAEATTVRSYLEWMTEIPWSKSTRDNLNIKKASKILDEDHYGLEEIKDRILEHLSVQKLKTDQKSPILCFVGAPGVGKTSLGKSIARALRRKFVRLSLGGVKDEAEIRGHRRTYVGSMPGRIIQGMRQAGSNNPVFMLDEVDKIGTGGHGDPSSALLEVLDPEQNDSFRDNFLGVAYDLSTVMFITTANLLHPIQPAFRDRMETIELPGYSMEEKVKIAQRFLVPRQIEENGLKKSSVKFSEKVIENIIEEYTEEAGVRNLERNIASTCRKVARKIAENGKKGPYHITKRNLEKYLGVSRIHKARLLEKDEIGVATGMAVTSSGGDILFVEAAFYPGKGGLTLTGHLGETMQESAKAALSYTRMRAAEFKIKEDFFATHDLHLHVPEGAVPKDGPSAGITMATAVFSACTRRPVAKNTAMTGEITLRGNVLPVGGIKEKILAAGRAGVKKILLPARNKNQLEEIESHLKKGLEFILCDNMDGVLKNVLLENIDNGGKKTG